MKKITGRLCAVALLIGFSFVVGYGKSVVFSIGADSIRDVSVDFARKAAHQTVGIQTVPEPSTMILLGTGLAGLLGLYARRQPRQ